MINAAFLPQLTWLVPFSAAPNLKDDKYGFVDPSSSPHVIYTTMGINSEPNFITEEIFLGKFLMSKIKKSVNVE